MAERIKLTEGELRYTFAVRRENGRAVLDATFQGPSAGVKFEGLTGNDARQIRNDLERAIRQLDEINTSRR